MGVSNITNITLENITQVANASSLNEFLISADRLAFGGPVYWFVILWLIWIISFFAAQQVRDQLLNNAMYSGAFVSILAVVLRTITFNGNSMITDAQMWVFPLITVILAAIIWSIKD